MSDQPSVSRSMWSGTIQFGMVSIPSKMYKATEEAASTGMHMLCPDHKKQIGYQVWCPQGHEVQRMDVIKGVPIGEGWATFTDMELARFATGSAKTVKVEEFVPRDSVLGSYRDTTYFVGPDKGGDRAYALLRAAMLEEGVVGIGKVTLRGDREKLCMITVEQGILCLVTLRWYAAVRSPGRLNSLTTEVQAKELEMARMLIGSLLSNEFDASQYHDEYTERLQAAIEGQEVIEQVDDEPKVLELMAALKASVDSFKQEEKPKKTKKAV